MVPRRDVGRRAAATPWRRGHAGTLVRMVLALGLGLVIGPAGAAEADRPADQVGLRAWMSARAWIDDFRPPPMDDEAARVPLPDVAGVAVVLRSRGRVVGSAAEWLGPDADEATTDRALRRTVGRALATVLGRVRQDDLPETAFEDVGERLVLEMELAGEPNPLLGRSFDRAAAAIEPGIHGLAVRRGDQWAALMPAEARARGRFDRIAGLFSALVVELGLPASELDVLRDRHGVAVYRFQTLTLAQPDAASAPVATHRGDRIVPARWFDRDAARTLAGELIDHLEARLVPSAGDRRARLGLMAGFDPLTGRVEPIIGPPRDQALAARALVRATAATSLDEDHRRRALDLAERVMADLLAVEEGEADPRRDTGAAAAIVLAALEQDGRLASLEQSVEEAARAATTLLIERADGERGFLEPDPEARGAIRRARTTDQALGAAALGAAAHRGWIEPGRARAALDAVWASTPSGRRYRLLPWITEAELALAGGEPHRVPAEPRKALAALSAALGPQHVDGLPFGHPRSDLVGGLDLGPATPWGPDSTSLPGLAHLARWPAAEDPRPVVLAGRFVAQLAIDPDDRARWGGWPIAAGGVRAAMWNREQDLVVQALALGVALDALAALEPPAP